MATRLLLVTTSKWLSTARLALALGEVGCTVDAVVPAGHPLRRADAPGKIYTMSGVRPAASIAAAIAASRPDLIVSCDEPALGHLLRVHAAGGAEVRGLIERSVGQVESLQTALARSALLRLAVEEGVATPATELVESAEDVASACGRLGLPMVLKADASAGGQGVRILTDAGQGGTIFRRLRRPVSMPRTAARALRERDWRPLAHFFRRQTTVVTAQEFITGREGNVGVSCWQGQVLACITLEVVRTWCVRGPSSVLRVVENEAMASAARRIVGRLGFTGFCGFDFIFREDGTPLLLEMNARPTQIAHLALGRGKDLAGAFAGAADGASEHRERAAQTDNPMIALFPQEWQREPRSPMLREAFHDVPWESPNLVRAGINARVTAGQWRPYERLSAALRGRSRRSSGGPRANTLS